MTGSKHWAFQLLEERCGPSWTYSSVASAASVLSAGPQGQGEVPSANSLNSPLICWYRLMAGFGRPWRTGDGEVRGFAMPVLGERAVVLGASMSGLLAARVLADYFRTVTVV